MNVLIEFFNNNVGFVGGILTLVIALSTVVYAVFTGRLAVETSRLRKVQSDPLISIILEPYSFAMHYIKIKIQNVGQGPAYNISYTFKENIDIGKNRHLSDLKYLKEWKYLKPSQELESNLGSYADLKDKKIYIKVNYENSKSEKFEEEFELIVNDFESIEHLGGDPLYDISQNTKKIEENLRNLVKSVDKLKDS
ncbi:MAG: hypothetical protein GWO07_11470 [Candidatus Dadabacteria bacterium]|nr:hypothetical protein [Candidatus Dadabacteria bacterium]NIS09359.1 hypothetical protein [Candidatus Dadabacteria bacterium]NIV42369.1 hypothetical protein [Candidatus Dadabacteria bacterium]NIX15895.1 hypothetical protein [Candidatus Dadabacteria bacterium]NIY22602.1 hypothetical protein [Candidatus Dadabacteria bacterium]